MNKPIILTLSLFFLFSCHTKRDTAHYDVIVQNVKLFDGDQVYENATVLIDSNKFKDIITSEPTDFVGDNVINAEGHTLTPGFINAHVHAFKEEHVKEAVQSGVLTLLDLFSSQPKVSDTLRLLGQTSSNHAYYYSAGPTVTVDGGHGSQFGPVPLVETVDDIPKFIDDRLAEGSDYIKLIIERGDASYTIPTLSDDMIAAAITRTHDKGAIAVAHATWRKDAINAAKMRLDGLAHLWSRDSLEMGNEELQSLKESGVFIIPTALVWKLANESKWRTVNMELLKKEFNTLHKAGIPLLAGTDPPNHKINYGTDLFKELELFVEYGMSPLEALKSATSLTSKSFKLGEKGYIKDGYSCDMVLIKGDPTQNIKDIYNIERVWKNGNEVKQPSHE